MDRGLRVVPPGEIPDGLPREAHVGSPLLQPLGLFRHPPAEKLEETARLRWQLVKRAAEDLGRETVRGRDVLERRLDVLDDLALVRDPLHLALVLVQKRDRPDEGEVLT